MEDELKYLEQEIDKVMNLAIAESEGDVLVRQTLSYESEDPKEVEHRLFQVRLRQQQLSTQEKMFEQDRRQQAGLDHAERERRLKEIELRQQVINDKKMVGTVVSTVIPPSLDYSYRHMRDTMQFKRSGPKQKSKGKPKHKSNNRKGGLDVLFGRSGGKGKSTLSNVAGVFNQQWREARFVLCDGGQRLLYYVKCGQSSNIVGELFRTSTPSQSSLDNLDCNDEDDLQSADQPTTEKKRYVRVEDVGLISLAYVKATEPSLERYETLDPKTGKFRLFTKEETITFKPMSKQKGMKWIQGIREATEKLPKHISTDVVINDHPITYQDLKKQRIQLEELSLLGQSTLKTFVLRDGTERTIDFYARNLQFFDKRFITGTLYCFKDEELEWTMFLWGATISEGGKKGANSTKRMEIKLSSKFPNHKTVSLRASDDISTLSFYTSVLKHKLFLDSFMELHQLLPST